ncbi:adenylate isopentenyltransferase 5, chloroplastic-like [Salvia miltiorrhiza]|uniref:adenylate isopentenyltransferase 5, chloroplastic-like n=1 Tax=Salvia miltiorrhiza TaxID=226208 RepID=UPI0025ACD8CE|nr:adenylate isopentenyltransferase 5, chloroplastic-like [Salvia miltiorrhiza]
MNISFSAACKQTQPPPMVNFPGGLLNLIPRQRRKEKVVVVMGATGTGKSRLSIELATRFGAEVINSDKMQVYKGLDIVTNKVNEEECGGVPHHLLGFVDPEADFWAHDFVYHASAAADDIAKRGRMPIIAGGSNSFIKALVNDDHHFRSRYDCCFLWVDVAMPLLHSFVSKRVDQMVDSGLVAEAREFFDPAGDYSRGIRRAIGVPELHEYFRSQGGGAARAKLLDAGIDQIKSNTRTLACRQLQNIMRLAEHLEWRMHRLDATEVFLKRGDEAEEAWDRLVAGPSTRILAQFLCEDHMDFVSTIAAAGSTSAAAPLILGSASTAAVAAATH